MLYARREAYQRGTPDLPFARYDLRCVTARVVMANTHWHPEQEILFVKAGSIEVLIGKNTFVIKENEICFVPPNALHSVISTSPNTAYYALVFSYDLLRLPDSHFFQSAVTEPMKNGRLAFPPILGSDDPHFPAAAAALEKLCRYSKEEPDYKFAIFHGIIALYTALWDTLVGVSNAENTMDNRAVKTCLDYMRLHYREKITLEALAKLVHLHPNYLCKLFKVYTGQTAFGHLLQIRLEKAAAALEKGGCSVSQAADLCGFESVSFFSRKFKQIIGCAPREYGKKPPTPPATEE